MSSELRVCMGRPRGGCRERQHQKQPSSHARILHKIFTRSLYGLSFRQKIPDHGRAEQPLHRLRHRQGLPSTGRRTRLQLRRRTLQGPHHRVCGRLRFEARLRLRRGRRCPDRQAVRRSVADLAQVRRLRAQHRLRAARGDRRRLSGRPVARGLQGRARHQRLQLSGHGQGCPALPQRQVGAAHADLPGRAARAAQLQHHGPGQGLARGLGALPGRVAGPQGHARQRHQRRSDQDAGRQRHQGLRQDSFGGGRGRRRSAATSPSRKWATWPPS